MTLQATVKKYRALFKSKPAVVTAHEPKGHFYVSPVSLEKYHSVTYFTSFIKDPSLSNWKMNRALEHVAGKFGAAPKYESENVYLTYYGFSDISSMLDQAKLAPEETFHNAGDIGTQTHAWRQRLFQFWIEEGLISLTDAEIDAFPVPTDCDPEVISGCRAIKRFLKETGYIPVACELALVDDELKVGGTIDDLGVFPNKGNPLLAFEDLKTSNQGKKVAYAYQVRGFYQMMIRKTFDIIPDLTEILHTSKDDRTYKRIDLTKMDFLEQDAANLVYLSRSWDRVQEAFKPKVITI